MRRNIEQARLQLLSRMHVDHCKAELWSGRLQEGGKVYEVRSKALLSGPLPADLTASLCLQVAVKWLPDIGSGPDVMQRFLQEINLLCHATLHRHAALQGLRCTANGPAAG